MTKTNKTMQSGSGEGQFPYTGSQPERSQIDSKMEEIKKEFKALWNNFDDYGHHDMTFSEAWNFIEFKLQDVRQEERKYGEPLSTFIQWKGTDLCMDWFCDEGHQNHWDGDFAYEIICETCNRKFKVNDSVKLSLLEEEK